MSLSLRVAYRLDLYMLRALAAPLAFVLAAALVAQLLERLLRLFDLAAATGAPVWSVFTMAAHLVPHYLGIALPAAFTVAMFLTLARLSDDSELDILLTSGRSLARVALPYFALSLALAAFSLYLVGHLQPLSRYAYRAAVHEALNTRWDSRVEANRFGTAGGGLVFNVEATDPDRRHLEGVFVQRRVDGIEEITTAPRGRLVPAAGGRLLLELDDGLMVREDATGRVWSGKFTKALFNSDFTPSPPPFRQRGDSVRELTLAELWQGMHDGSTTSLAPQRLAGEFHGRLARSLLLPLLPLLAIPLGMAAKRGGRAPGAVFAGLALLVLNHSLQFGESMAESGRADAIVAVWAPVAVFAALCLWIFRGSLAWPGDNPLTRAASRVGDVLERLRRRAAGARG
ncbi:MAG: YjgP/YjgQ family permease [Betaproteobacteria bacterium]|nr:MAG: YjgP/YjgQ family permease [Betaproteobacteria bacterium]